MAVCRVIACALILCGVSGDYAFRSIEPSLYSESASRSQLTGIAVADGGTGDLARISEAELAATARCFMTHGCLRKLAER